jgi:phosphatidylglycerol---prolipoprotein diacylglyceryl transferase
VVLFLIVGLLVRSGALKRPGIVTGIFAIGYGVARITCEFFREPDVQLGFLWGDLTMGMLLCIPLIIGGIAILLVAVQRLPKPKNG